MKVLTEAEGSRLKAALGKTKKSRRRRTHNERRFTPGVVVSVQLRQCGHRARLEPNGSGFVPIRARCPLCHRWRTTLEETARKPLRLATREVVAESIELRDGRAFTVKTLKTPRRVRWADSKRTLRESAP